MELQQSAIIKTPADYAKAILLAFAGNKVEAARYVIAQTKLGKNFRNEAVTALQSK